MFTIGIDASRANREIKTGTEWYSYYLIEELKKITAGDSNRYFLFTDKKLKGDLSILPKNWQEKVLSWPLKYLWTQKRLSLEMLFRSVDVLFVPAHAIPLIHPKNTVTTIHDLGFRRFPQAYSSWQRFYYHFVHYFASQQAKKIIVPSEFTKKELIDLYHTPLEKIEVIPLGYNEKIFKVIKDKDRVGQILAKYKIEKPYLLYVGRIESKKGIEDLLEAYSKFSILDSGFSLVLAGQPGFGYHQIKSKIQNLKAKICELGYVSQDDLPYLYNGAEAFVFPSLYEGFALPICEALACGLPVLSSRAGSLPEVGGQAVLYADFSRGEDVVQKIKEIIFNQDLREYLKTAGFERIKKFSWQKCAQKTLAVLLDCVKI
jgi:glycosyltransferase involved in cell wall biosynthesis